MHTQVCVVGGGVSGLVLSARLALDSQAGDPFGLTLVEADSRCGGVAWSELHEGRVIDQGPSSWLSGEPALDRAIELAGQTSAVLGANPAAKARYVWAAGELHPVPMSPPALLRTKLISWPTRLRMLLEPLVSRGDEASEESVADFAARRLGVGVVDRLVAPMVAGIYGADPRELSLKAAFPALAAMERQHGSLLLGAMRSGGKGPRPGLQALRGGAGSLSRGLTDALGSRVRTGVRVRGVEAKAEHWVIHTDEERFTADAVVLAAPAGAQAAILRGLDPDAARALDEIPYAPLAVFTAVWPADAFPRPVQGFGVLVAGDSRAEVPVLGTLFVSSTFPSHAPEGEIILRTMVGGQPDPAAYDLDDQQIAARCHAAHARMLGVPKGAPLAVHLQRHPKAIPQYTSGHLRRVAVARQAMARHPGLFLVGSHLDGPGVRDCARTANAVADQVRRWLETGETDPGLG